MLGTRLVSPEMLRLSSFVLFFLLILICMILTALFADIPEETEITRMFGYNNICVYLDYPPAAHIAPTLWIFFLMPTMAYAFTWLARLESRIEATSFLSRALHILTACELFAFAHFVQCFANKPHDMEYPRGLKMHTYPFTLFIIAMWSVSAKSAWWFTTYETLGLTFGGLARLWGFTAFYFVISFLKVLIHVNFFLDGAFWIIKADWAQVMGQRIDVIWCLCFGVAVPLAIWLMEYREGDRIEMSLKVVTVGRGDFDLMGRRAQKEVPPQPDEEQAVPTSAHRPFSQLMS